MALIGNRDDYFDLTQATFSGFSTLTTDASFDIKMTSDQFASLTSLQGTWYNFLTVVGPVVDIRGKTITQFWGIDIDPGTTVYANDLTEIDQIDAFNAAGDTLRFFGQLSPEQRAAAHKAGYDTVVDDTGQASANPAPVVTGLSGERQLVRPGEIVFLDLMRDAKVSDDQGTISRITVRGTGGSPFGGDSLRIVGDDRLTFVKRDYGSTMYFDGVEIGNHSKEGGYSQPYAYFYFKEDAPSEAVDYVLQHIEFVRGNMSRSDAAIQIEIADRGGRTTTATVLMQGENTLPSAPLITSTFPTEAARPGDTLAYLTSFDNDRDTVSYSLLNDHGGLFSVRGSALILNGRLDFEQKASYKIEAIAIDQRGGRSLVNSTELLIGDVAGETVIGTGGSDTIRGGLGRDDLSGAGGNDRLFGGVDNDILRGGDGKDAFVFNTAIRRNVDRITDFNAKDDTIWLENAIFTKLGKAGSIAAPKTLNKKFFVTGDKAKDGNDYIVYNKKTGALFYDADGSGAGMAVQIATLTKKLKLTFADFEII